MPGNDDLVHGGHADEVGSKGPEGADLGGSLVAGTEDGEGDAFVELPALPVCFVAGELTKSGGVGLGHVEEPLAKTGFVRPERSVGSGEVYVIGERDDGALTVVGVDAAGSVRHDGVLDSQEAEGAGWG